jgi:hypothetical protein
MALRACAAAVALRAYAAAEWRCRACGCLMALRLRACAAAEWRCRACGDRMALRAYAAAEWRCEACGCLMALRCATPLSARRPAAGVCGGRVALQGVRRPNGAAGVCGGRMALGGVRLPNGAAVCDATVGAPTRCGRVRRSPAGGPVRVVLARCKEC